MLFPGNAVAFPRDIDQNDPGRGPLIMAITWIFQIATFAAVMARVAVRRHKQVRLGWDDYLMLLALIIQLGLQALATSSFTNGMGKHDASLSPDQMMTILRDNWESIPAGIIVSLSSRTSIALLLSHLFAPYKWFRNYLIFFTALMWIAGIVVMPVTFLQVRPVEALWNFTIVPERHWDTRVWLYITFFFQSCCTFSDLTYAVFPVIFIWKLNMPLRQRISLIGVLCGSILSMTMSILKTISMSTVANATEGTPDVQYNSSTSLIYGFVEQNVVIIMGCIPSLRAVMKLEFSKLSILRRYYLWRKSSTGDYDSNGYNDLDDDSHKLNYINTSKGVSKASARAGDSFTGFHTPDENHYQLPVQGKITRTDNYTVSFDPKGRMPRETV